MEAIKIYVQTTIPTQYFIGCGIISFKVSDALHRHVKDKNMILTKIVILYEKCTDYVAMLLFLIYMRSRKY